MKIKKPMTPVDHFEAAREILAHSNYKIFTPHGRYFRQKHQLIAAKSFGTKKLFLLQLRKDTLMVSALPPCYGDSSVVQKIEHELGITITKGRPLFRLTDDDPWDAARFYITPRGQIEFDLFVKENLNARLP
jgi:hypothetical protein